MRSPGFVVMALAFGLSMLLPAQQASALNVDNIIIYKGIQRTNGVVDTNGYQLHVEVNATGMDNGGVFQNQSTGVWYLLSNAGGGKWEYNQNFATKALLDAAHPSSGDYFFLNSRNSNHSLPPFQDQVLLGYGANAPSTFANILNPLQNATGVPLNPVYNWDNMSGLCHILGLQVRIEPADLAIYRDEPENNTGRTTWQPGLLLGNTNYMFSVDAMNLTGKGPMYLATLKGDAFTYYGPYGQENSVDFTTVPEPVTMALVGTGMLVLVGLRRRRRMA